MNAAEKDVFRAALENLGTISLVLGATLAVIDQQNPGFKMTVIASLPQAAARNARMVFASLDSQIILGKAAQYIAGL